MDDQRTGQPSKENVAETLEWLRSLIPAIPACDRCGECCQGRLVANEEEWLQIQEYAQNHQLSYQFYGNYTCGWHQTEVGACAIYPVRPLFCRIYGAVRQHPCGKIPEAATVDLPDSAIDPHYRGPWYRLNGRPLGPIESEYSWSGLLRPYMEDSEARLA